VFDNLDVAFWREVRVNRRLPVKKLDFPKVLDRLKRREMECSPVFEKLEECVHRFELLNLLLELKADDRDIRRVALNGFDLLSLFVALSFSDKENILVEPNFEDEINARDIVNFFDTEKSEVLTNRFVSVNLGVPDITDEADCFEELENIRVL
jgi:hypothetical protein